jgi:hypothetical protein
VAELLLIQADCQQWLDLSDLEVVEPPCGYGGIETGAHECSN